MFADCYIVYKHLNQVHYGVIHKIFAIRKNNIYLLKMQPMKNINYDTLTIHSKTFINEHIIFGNLADQEVHLISLENVIEKACFYSNGDISYFARYPNFYESSQNHHDYHSTRANKKFSFLFTHSTNRLCTREHRFKRKHFQNAFFMQKLDKHQLIDHDMSTRDSLHLVHLRAQLMSKTRSDHCYKYKFPIIIHYHPTNH